MDNDKVAVLTLLDLSTTTDHDILDIHVYQYGTAYLAQH